jgi:two-component sensor histidine kinase
VVGSIVGGYRWRVFLLRKENERLDRIVHEKTEELEKTIGQLRVSSKQKDILMKETHHRVKNNLQVISTLLSLQLNKIDDDDARRSIEESSARINSIALVHYKLYKGEQLNTLEISGFAGELLAQLKVVYLQSEQEMILENNIPETWLDIDTALPLGLILNELMTNSFKYAYEYQRKCRMQIGLVRKGNTFILQYFDNGPGLPEGYDVKKGKSLGMTIIKSLAKQLGGSFSYSADDNCFMVKFLDTDARKNIA